MNMDSVSLEFFWSTLPTDREHAWTYDVICAKWNRDRRTVRAILHELSRYDNGDDYVLIRSSHGPGFYKTDDPGQIKAYRRECLNRGRRTLAPIKKINRVLALEAGQLSFENNLRAVRMAAGLKSVDVCRKVQAIDPSFDAPMLSRMETGKCMPTPAQLAALARIYGCEPAELISVDVYQ